MSAPDLEHLEVESAQRELQFKGPLEVLPDAEAGDSTSDQENRGFVHILDAIHKEQLKKRRQKRKSQRHMYSKGSQVERAIQRYIRLSDAESSSQLKGSRFNKTF